MEDLDISQIVADLRQKAKGERGFIAKLAKNTGIPQDRMYKWIDGRGTPKYQDAFIVQQFMEAIPNPPPAPVDPVLGYLQEMLPKILQTSEAVQARLAAKIVVDAQHRGGAAEVEKINRLSLEILLGANPPAGSLESSQGKG